MTRRARVDAELVRRGLARSRQQAAELIGAGRVSIDGMPAVKPATAVAVTANLTVEGTGEKTWVSRGATNSSAHSTPSVSRWPAAAAWTPAPPPEASPKYCWTAALPRSSPSTSATDSLPGHCAPMIGCGSSNGPNVRDLTPEAIGGRVDVVVADLSFISLATVLPALTACANAGADIVPMVKPQFEVGRHQVGSGGVVSDPQLRATAVLAVAGRAEALGWQTVDVTASPLPGPSGNVEYFLRLRATTERALHGDELDAAVRRAVAEGPQ